jgi:hypothetical protein
MPGVRAFPDRVLAGGREVNNGVPWRLVTPFRAKKACGRVKLGDRKDFLDAGLRALEVEVGLILLAVTRNS